MKVAVGAVCCVSNHYCGEAKLMRLRFPIAVYIWCSRAVTAAFGQRRDFRAERFLIDDNNGNTHHSDTSGSHHGRHADELYRHLHRRFVGNGYTAFRYDAVGANASLYLRLRSGWRQRRWKRARGRGPTDVHYAAGGRQLFHVNYRIVRRVFQPEVRWERNETGGTSTVRTGVTARL